MKLELILRLLDNDELSAEHVNDVKDFLEDYVERNQVCFCCNFLRLRILKNLWILYSKACVNLFNDKVWLVAHDCFCFFGF